MSHTAAWLPLGMLLGAAVCSGCAKSSRADTNIGNVGWAMYNMSYDGVRSSPLTEITVGNVQSLRPVCRIKLGEEGSFHTGPVVVGDTMFVTTAHSTVALDATTCKPIWRFVDPPTKADVYGVNRGVAYRDGRVFRGTPDGRLVALRSDSGRVLWNVKVGDPAVGEFTSSAPVAWGGTVFIGLAGGDWGGRGRVMAFDAATGEGKGRFWTGPVGDERGGGARAIHDRHWRAAGTACEQGREYLRARPAHARARVQDTDHHHFESRLHAHPGGGARVPGAVGRCRVERTGPRRALTHDLCGGRRLVCDL